MRKGYSEKVLSRVIAALKELRKAKGISHQTLADKAGITRPAISHLENGRRRPTLLLCLKLAEAMEISLGDIINKAEK